MGVSALSDRLMCSITPCTEPVASGPRPWAEQLRARHLEALRRQLHVELKVKQGAENMTHTCASGTPKVRPHSLMAGAPWPLVRQGNAAQPLSP